MEVISAFQIYLFGLLLNLKSDVAFLGFLMFWVCVGLGIAWFMSKDEYVFEGLSEYTDSIAKWFKRAIITFICLILTCILAPTKEIATAMFVVPPVVNNEKVQEIPKNVIDFVNGWLKENTKKEEPKEDAL